MTLQDLVREKVENTLNESKNDLNGALIDIIHPDINVKYNSVNVIVGKQGQGKTVIALEEILKIALLQTSKSYQGTLFPGTSSHNKYHLLVYVTKDGRESDKTFTTLKPLIEPHLPIITVSEENIKDVIKDIIEKKNDYYQIKNNHLEDLLDDPELNISHDEVNTILHTLHINDFSSQFLHTIVLFDDISNNKLFDNETSYFSQLIRRCRHINFTFFLLIQGWKGLKPHIKNEITTLFIFPCFNRQQLHFIYSQSASNMDFDEFYNEYTKILRYKSYDNSSHPYLVVQVHSGGDTYSIF